MKKNTLTYSLLSLILTTTGCTYNVNSTPEWWFKAKGLTMPADDGRVSLCQNFGCTKSTTIQLTQQDLEPIHQLFTPPPNSAEEERALIAKAMGLFEAITGPKIGTSHDKAKNAFSLRSSQLDCIAESSNSSAYLLILKQHNLIKFHRVGGNIHRGPLTLNAPHNSAVVVDISTSEAYAVDSWFGANGEPAWITPSENWLSGSNP